jgi:hypothetical protein
MTTARALAICATLIAFFALAVAVAAYREVDLQARIAAANEADAVLAREAYKDLKAAKDYGALRTDQLSLERENADVPAEALLFDVDAALAPITQERLLEIRQNLIHYVWKDVTPGELKPSMIIDGARTANMALVEPSAPVKTIRVNSSEKLSGFTEFAQHGSATCLTVWAQGHEGEPGNAPITTGAILFLKKQWAAGCDILIVPMPFRAEGNITLDLGTNGKVWVGANHEGMALLETSDFSAFRLFFDPLFASLNWLEDNGHRYETITMAGVSGGGWMSTVYPAIDTRITRSIAVAGSFPSYLRYLLTDKSFRDVGDWELTYAPFYQIANYFELYLLSALGPGRSQTLVYNAADPCCFSGRRAMTFLPRLERKAKELNISLSSIVDNTHQKHDISEFVISAVSKSMERDLQANTAH